MMARPFSHVLWIGLALLVFGAALLLAGCADVIRAGAHCAAQPDCMR